MNTLKEVMLKHHLAIDQILEEFNSNIYGENARGIFSRFLKLIEKHFAVEEQTVFKLYESINSDAISDLFELMQEHGDITAVANNISEGIEKGVIPNISGLKQLLHRHIKFENDIFYPKLDELLSEEKKKELIEKVELEN
jgi:hemerythrin-like domain-containing protein